MKNQVKTSDAGRPRYMIDLYTIEGASKGQ
jgi:hypothetical protein